MYNNFSSKKTKKVISALLATALVATSAPITADAATAKVVGVGKTVTYKAGATVKKVTVKNKKVVKATISKKNKKNVTLKGLKAGKTTVTVKTSKKTVKLTVKVGATSITKKTVTTSMTAGQKKTLSVNAVNGKGDTIQFTSNKKSVVKVNKASAKANSKKVASTTVTALKAGTAKITAKSKYTGKSKTFTIKVAAAPVATTPAVASTPAVVATTPAATATTTNGPSVPGGNTTPTPQTTTGAATTAPTADATNAPESAQPDNTNAPEATDVANTPGPNATDAPVAAKGNVAVTTNVSGASIKVLSGTAVVAEKTLEGEDLSATLVDIENGTYTVQVSKAGYGTFTEVVTIAGNTVNVKADIAVVALQSVKVTSETRLQLNFNGEIDEETVKVENFKVSGVTVTSAKLTEDKKTVILETTTMTKDEKYTVTTANLTSNGVAIADAEAEFIGKEIQYELKLSFADDKRTLVSNGQDSVLVTAQLFDEDGAEVKDLDKVEIKFSTTAGSFSENKVTVQNGVATNTLQSETSTTDISALITATVVSASNKNLLNVSASTTVLMQPKIDTEVDETMGATLTSVAAETCDRIVLYFNKDVDIADYTVQDETQDNVYGLNGKLDIKIEDKAPNGQTTVLNPNKTVIGLKTVDGSKNALEAILDVDNGDYLTDNSNLVVDVTDSTKTVSANGKCATLVSDIRVPSILGVENNGLRSLKITFSEPIQNENGSALYNAADADHWVIDGTPLGSAKWGVQGTTVEVGEYNLVTGVDERNVVTITLGQTAAGKQIYFTSGSHSIQGNKIGDWANMTDTKNNIINTQTLDFTIDPDDSVPTAEVSVDSPEQYTVTFNKLVDIDDVENNLVLQAYNKTSATWGNLHTVADGGIVVEAVGSQDDTTAKEFVVTVTKDWTEELTTSTSHENYYNNSYRLHIEAGKIVNLSNGKTNAEQNLLLNDEIMTTPDIDSPEIVSVVQNGTTDNFTITMNEPVQVPNILGETITPSETQGSLAGVPSVTVTFIKDDNSVTVPATITKMMNAHDKEFVVKPLQDLEAGTYRVVVASISDDVGNTSKTLADAKLDVKATTAVVDNSFKALWAVAVPVNHENPMTGTIDTNDDIVYIKFNKQFKTYGAASNAVSTTNYTVGGISVPTTSKIDVSLAGYNENANIKNGYTDLVAIHLAAGTLNDKDTESNSIFISSTIEALTGGKLSNGGMKVLDFVDDGSTAVAQGAPGSGSHVEDYYAWNYATHDYSTLAAAKTLTVTEVQNLLANTDYVDYDFNNTQNSQTLTVTTGKYTISHAGKYDFTGQTIEKLTINTAETGNIEIVGGTYGEIEITAPNAEVTLDNITTLTSIQGTLASAATASGNVTVKNVMNGSLVIAGSTATNIAGKVVVSDNDNGSKISVPNGATVTITGGISIETKDEVTLDTNGVGAVTVKDAATVNFLSAPASVTLVQGSEGAKVKAITGLTVTVTDNSNNTTKITGAEEDTSLNTTSIVGYYSDNNGDDTALVLTKNVGNGTELASAGLPTTAYAKLSNDTYVEVTLAWGCDDYNASNGGTFTATATVAERNTDDLLGVTPKALTATVTVAGA